MLFPVWAVWHTEVLANIDIASNVQRHHSSAHGALGRYFHLRNHVSTGDSCSSTTMQITLQDVIIPRCFNLSGRT